MDACLQLQLGAISKLIIARPQALNALNREVFVELDKALIQVATYRPRVLIVTGAGSKAFVAGADIPELEKLSPEQAEQTSEFGQQIFSRFENLTCPTIAAVNGYALGGGCELALACDIIYASDTAKFGFPEVKLGIIPGYGGTVRLRRKVGIGHACAWIFTGDIFDAQHALSIGLVQKIAPATALMQAVETTAEQIAQRGPLAVAAAKHVLMQSFAADTQTASALERHQFAALFATQDKKEGMRSFLEKRAPKFQGA